MKNIKYSLLLAVFFTAKLVSAQNLLNNGGFENNFSNWNNLAGDGAIATYSISNDAQEGTNSMKVAISTLGSNVYSVQSLHSGWLGVVGKMYKINFYAKSLQIGSEIRIGQPTTGFKSTTFSLNKTWQLYEFTYVSTGINEKLLIQFSSLDTYFIDGLRIEEFRIFDAPIPPSGNSSLKALAANCGLNMANLGDRTNEPDFEKILKNDFNMLGSENSLKMGFVKRTETGAYDFSGPDRMVNYAEANGMKLRGHTILWHAGLPDWVKNKNWTRQTLLSYLKSYIQTVVGRYKGKIDEWDVANEFVNGSGLGLRDGNESVWIRFIGPAVLDSAFKWVHQTDPQAKLYYNDFAAEGLNLKSNYIYNMVKDMKDRGVPIHGVGMQCHFKFDQFLTPSVTLAKDMDSNIKRLGALGLEVAFTEIDIAIPTPVNTENYKLQAVTYGNLLQIALNNPRIVKTFMIWGITDKYTWIRDNTQNAFDDPLFYTRTYQKKSAYDQMVAVLKSNCVVNALPEINVKLGNANILAGTGTYEFAPDVAVGNVSAPVTFTIQNTGNTNLTIGAITLIGANPLSFVVTQVANPIIQGPLGSTAFTISYKPTFVGPKSAIVSIANNDATENPYTFAITAKTPTLTSLGDMENDNLQTLTIYPNPSTDGVFNLSKTVNWKAYSILGKELLTGNGNQINLSEQPKGVYLVKVNERIERVVVE